MNYIEIVDLLGKQIKDVYASVAKRHKLKIFDKATYDEVTNIDFEVEKNIIEKIKQLDNNAAFLSEEFNKDTSLLNGRVWIIDPIDGTCNLTHGSPHFGIQCALIENGNISLSIIYFPKTRELFSAVKGEGAYLNGKRIFKVERPVNRCLVSFGDFIHNDENMFELEHRIIKRTSARVERVRMFGAASMDFAFAACGRLDGNFTFIKNPWDIVAGILLCREAGLLVTDAYGNEYDFSRDTVAVFASNELKEACIRD
ncbi:MAG: inositol monophosphatase [Clostridiales bacterium]|nr:inositol monophosphatase [Clostridiales bacterium]